MLSTGQTGPASDCGHIDHHDTDESGPEHIYRVELAEDGFLALGLMRTDNIYGGDTEYSLRMDGLEPGINDNARDRNPLNVSKKP